MKSLPKIPRRQFLQAGALTTGAAASGLLLSNFGSSGRMSFAGDSSKKPTGLVMDPIYWKHQTGEEHPERSARLDAVKNALQGLRDAGALHHIHAELAESVDMLACHSQKYLELARQEIEAGAQCLSTGDTVICKDSWNVAVSAAGGVLAAVDAVFAGTVSNAFCAIRPPGHHACPSRGMGFCVLNNVALAVRHAQREYKVDKVLVIDWDVHHGNGTQEIFNEDPSVLFFDTHQHPWYPKTGMAEEVGLGKAKGTKINCPFPAGTGREQILQAFESKLLPAVAKFKPEMVFISAGFDAREGDPLGKFLLKDQDYADMTRMVMQIAKEHAGGRIVSLLEGGYNPPGLGLAAKAHVEVLSGRA